MCFYLAYHNEDCDQNKYLEMRIIMRSNYFIVKILFLSLFFTANVITVKGMNYLQKKEKKFSFVDDQLLMNDIEKETSFVDSALHVAKTLSVNLRGQEKSRILSLSNREQAIKFFKYLNTAVESNGKLRFVFYDNQSDKLVNLSSEKKNHLIYIKLSWEQFEDKLQAGEIDFKLMENKSEVADTLSASQSGENK